MFKCTYEPSESRIASVLIGTTMMAWSPSVLLGSGTLSQVLEQHTLSCEWFYAMFFIGLVIVLGAIMPQRKLRHIGLSLGIFVWLSTFGVYLRAGRLTPVVATCLIFALASAWLMITDSRRKPREKH